MSPFASTAALPFETEQLRERAGWLIRLRWFAVAGIAITGIASARAGIIDTQWQVLGIAGAMAALNALVWVWLGSHTSAGLAQLQRLVAAQLVLDVVALSVLLHFADSVENPFVMLFAFPVAVGATLLPTRLAFSLSGFAAAAHSAVIVAEYGGVLPHHPFAHREHGGELDPLLEDGTMLAGYVLAFIILMVGVTYFVENVARRHRRAHALWRHRESLAESRERLARVGQIAAGVAHSVRNPLHGLINAVDLVAAQVGDDPTTQETLALMEEGLNRIERVTHRLLVLTRDAPPRPRPTDIDQLVGDTVGLLVSPRVGAVRVSIEHRPGRVGVADVDPDQLSEALANVLNNAVQACESGGGVTVTTSAADDGAPITIAVDDEGTGIAATDAPYLFDPFFTTKPVGSGTGLGLPISRRIVEDHGGEIHIAARSGGGVRVTITIPRHARAPKEERDA